MKQKTLQVIEETLLWNIQELETKKEKLALNLQNLVNLYIEDRDE